MPLHLVKLCVGCDSVEDLEGWIAEGLHDQRSRGQAPEQVHTTRMIPKRAAEMTPEGSLYWVIKGQVQCRQRLLAVRPFTGGDGVGRCHLVLQPAVVRTDWQPRRAFQGWRYLPDEDAPGDIPAGRVGWHSLPPDLRNELASLGLL